MMKLTALKHYLLLETLLETVIREKDIRSFVPKNVAPSVFTTFVYDNCDHYPETIRGETMHCTNGILIQKRVEDKRSDSEEPAYQQQVIKKRSFQPVLSSLDPYYQPKERLGPQPLGGVEQNKDFICEYLARKAVCLVNG